MVDHKQENFPFGRTLIHIKGHFEYNALIVCTVILTARQRARNSKMFWYDNVKYNQLVRKARSI